MMDRVRPQVVGLVSETHSTYPRRPSDPDDYAAEYEPESTIAVLEAAIRRLGHVPRRLGSPLDLVRAAAGGELGDVDAALNIAEGYGSRNREAWAPAILEMAGVPTLGSDALTLSLTLDKAWANRWAASAGIPIAAQCVAGPEAVADLELPAPFPLFVKPRWEGTSKGIRRSSRVESRAALAREVDRIAADYGQPALVERFVPGAEYTATVVGNSPPRALPVLQRALEAETGIGLHALEGAAPPGGWDHHVPGALTPELERELQEWALLAYETFECLDFARVDFRLDETGHAVFLEINPLPTFATDGSFAILAELEGRALDELLADVLGAGLDRLSAGHRPPASVRSSSRSA